MELYFGIGMSAMGLGCLALVYLVIRRLPQRDAQFVTLLIEQITEGFHRGYNFGIGDRAERESREAQARWEMGAGSAVPPREDRVPVGRGGRMSTTDDSAHWAPEADPGRVEVGRN